jgi:streptogramin lyase
MKKSRYIVICLILLLVITGIVFAAEFECKGEKIEKNGSFWGYAKKLSSSEYRIEKGSYTIAFVKKQGSKWNIEDTAKNTLGRLNGNTIEKPNDYSWTSLSTAKSLCNGPDEIAAAIWVLKQHNKL